MDVLEWCDLFGTHYLKCKNVDATNSHVDQMGYYSSGTFKTQIGRYIYKRSISKSGPSCIIFKTDCLANKDSPPTNFHEDRHTYIWGLYSNTPLYNVLFKLETF